MKRFLPNAVKAAAILVVTVSVYQTDPAMESKAHGPMLMALAFIFVLQDSLFWLCNRKVEDFLKSDGIAASDLPQARLKVTAFKRHARRLWVQTLFFRLVALVTGIVLTYSAVSPNHRTVFGLLGYVAVVTGLLIALQTYSLYQHADEEHSRREVMGREAKAREEASAAIQENNPADWETDQTLSGYGERVRLKPR